MQACVRRGRREGGGWAGDELPQSCDVDRNRTTKGESEDGGELCWNANRPAAGWKSIWKARASVTETGKQSKEMNGRAARLQCSDRDKQLSRQDQGGGAGGDGSCSRSSCFYFLGGGDGGPGHSASSERAEEF